MILPKRLQILRGNVRKVFLRRISSESQNHKEGERRSENDCRKERMDQYVTGTAIKSLREKSRLTQAQLAEKLQVSDKTISKWETGKGYPDITLLEPLAKALSVSATELLSGSAVKNANVSANMMRSKFYVCPVCGNVVHAMGEAVVSCHGVTLAPCEAEACPAEYNMVCGRMERPCVTEEGVPEGSEGVMERKGSFVATDGGNAAADTHRLRVETVEDEYYVTHDHEMTKSHYISFIAAASADRMQIVKLYPEGNAQARFKKNGVRKFYFYCNRDGLFAADALPSARR